MKKTKSLFNTEHSYSDEEILEIKKNLKAAFGVDGLPLEIDLKNLVKDGMDSFNFIIGEQYCFFNPVPNNTYGMKKGWHIAEVTYQRLDLVFFKIITSTKPDVEQYANKDSVFTKKFMPIDLDINRFGIPEKNLPLIIFDKHKSNPFEIQISINNNSLFTI